MKEKLEVLRAPVGKTVATRQLTLAPGLVIGLKLYTSANDAEGSGLHRVCPDCHEPINMLPTCKVHGDLHGAYHQAYTEGEQPIILEKSDLTELVIPQSDGSVKPFPPQENFLLQARLGEKEAAEYLDNMTNKYYLLPEGPSSVTLYYALKENLLKKRQSLLVKFSLKTSRQNLAVIRAENDLLVLCVVPFESQIRPAPQPKFPSNLDPRYVTMLGKILMEIPDAPAETPQDDYGIAFDYLVQQKLMALLESQLSGATKKKPAAKVVPSELETMIQLVKGSKGKRPTSVKKAPAKTKVKVSK